MKKIPTRLREVLIGQATNVTGEWWVWTLGAVRLLMGEIKA